MLQARAVQTCGLAITLPSLNTLFPPLPAPFLPSGDMQKPPRCMVGQRRGRAAALPPPPLAAAALLLAVLALLPTPAVGQGAGCNLELGQFPTRDLKQCTEYCNERAPAGRLATPETITGACLQGRLPRAVLGTCRGSF